MDINSLRSATTVLSFIVFIALLWWAYTPRHKARFDEAAQVPFQHD